MILVWSLVGDYIPQLQCKFYIYMYTLKVSVIIIFIVVIRWFDWSMKRLPLCLIF